MLDVAISQMTTMRWEPTREIERLAAHGFAALAVWRPKLSDTGPAAMAAAVAAAGLRASSLQAAGGFTGVDGRSFRESVVDAEEAIEAAAILGGAAPSTAPPVVVLHAGCRGGHTRTHAMRLLLDALTALARKARREGVGLAIEPLHAAAAPDSSLVAGLDEALQVVDAIDDPAVGIALDLWHFGDDPGLAARLPRLAEAASLVQVADRRGPPVPCGDRLPAGRGELPLERIAGELVRHGYRGGFEFDPVGEDVEAAGYDNVLGATRLVADAWAARFAAATAVLRADPAHDGGPAAARAGHSRLAAGSGSRRSQASSQAVSRG
ncbi:MAG: sugar phosphate isomerase/epimerase family protein [Planctomycetaceae bacterium]